MTASAAGCSALLPTDWALGVPGAPMPDEATAGAWIAFADAQTGRLDLANGRTRDALAIVRRCEDRDRSAVERSRRGWLRRLLG